MNYCPNCRNEIYKPKGTAQGIRGCKNCEARYYILETTPPKNKSN